MKLIEAFAYLNGINCNEHTELKGSLTYLSWAWAWQIFKMAFPASYYTVYEDANGNNYFTDGKTAWVKTGVTLVADDGQLELIEMLPVMDNRNTSIKVSDDFRFTSHAVNTSIQRSLTKAIARHGLGLYIYAGEDIPSDPCDGEPDLDLTPAKKPQEQKPKSAIKSQPLSEVRKNAMREMSQHFGLDAVGFARLVKDLASKQLVVDKPFAAMTDDEFGMMLKVVSEELSA